MLLWPLDWPTYYKVSLSIPIYTLTLSTFFLLILNTKSQRSKGSIWHWPSLAVIVATYVNRRREFHRVCTISLFLRGSFHLHTFLDSFFPSFSERHWKRVNAREITVSRKFILLIKFTLRCLTVCCLRRTNDRDGYSRRIGHRDGLVLLGFLWHKPTTDSRTTHSWPSYTLLSWWFRKTTMCVIVSKCSSLTLIIKCLLKTELDKYLDLC